MLKELISSAQQGIVYRQGVRTAIVGRRNVGKSSLLNRLLRQSRAIVSPVPGTTRDTVEEVVNLKGVPFVLTDTAGMVQRKGLVESLGVARSRKAIEQADIVLLVLDASTPLRSSDREIIVLLSELCEKEVLVAANKCDLPRRATLDNIAWNTVSVSALSGEGLDKLEQMMVDCALGGKVYASDALLVSNPRHKACLERAEDHLEQALSSIASHGARRFHHHRPHRRPECSGRDHRRDGERGATGRPFSAVSASVNSIPGCYGLRGEGHFIDI